MFAQREFVRNRRFHVKEARIIFPRETPNQNTAIYQMNRAIIAEFGGASEFVGNGFWKAPNGKEFAEEIIAFDIAYEPSDENDAKLYDIAWHAMNQAGEQSVYLRYGNGHVQLITEKSCMDNGHGHFDVSLSGVLEAVNIMTDAGQTLSDRLNAFEYLESSIPFKTMKKVS